MRSSSNGSQHERRTSATERRILEWLRRSESDPETLTVEQLGGRGPVAEFETALRRYYGIPFCLATNSATNALLALAIACDFRGADIITTPVSYGSTWAPFELLGARFVFAKVRPRTQTLDVASIPPLITRRTRAVLAVDWTVPHDGVALRKLCDRHRLRYIADAARSFGRRSGKHPASSLADAWVLSFGPGKPLFCGEGGAILTRDEALYHRLVALTQHPHRFRREVSLTDASDRQPLNARMHPLAAILGLAQLEVRGEDVRREHSRASRRNSRHS